MTTTMYQPVSLQQRMQAPVNRGNVYGQPGFDPNLTPYGMARNAAAAQTQQQQQAQQPAIQPQTSITVPEGIYTPRQTQAAANQAIASNHAQADLRQAMKQFDRPGVSRSAGSVAAALPQVVQANTAAANAATSIPLLDAIANAQHVLGAQTARENEATSMGSLGMRLLEDQNKQSQAYQSALMQPLLSILSALGVSQ